MGDNLSLWGNSKPTETHRQIADELMRRTGIHPGARDSAVNFIRDLWCTAQRERESELMKEVERLRTLADGAVAAKDCAYEERDRLVAVLSKVFPAHLMRHPDEDLEWEDDWRWIVCVELPTGQATWHFHDSELPWFDHLEPRVENTWDGHTTEEKYRRLEALTPKETTP